MTKVINLLGGPGSGKSTTAAFLFASMKMAGLSCELVTEFAKALTWQGRQALLTNNQAYVHAKQLHYLDSVVGKVDYLITDSPTILSAIYAKPDYPTSFVPFVLDIFNRYDNYNYFINRLKIYSPIGRNQTEAEARAIDEMVLNFMNNYGIKYTRIDGDKDAASKIIKDFI